MEAVLEKDLESETVVNIIDKKLLEAEELEAKGGQYYTQDEMNSFFAKYENV